MRICLSVLSTLLALPVYAQTDSLSGVSLLGQPVEIKAARLTVALPNAPLAVSVLNQARLQTATQQLSPYEVMGSVPGVFALNPDNYSQDLRLSIRGFGARAAFGIRGIRVFTDGLPEGTPDGQVDVDNIDMGAIGQMEVLRGAAAGLYGNAAGGVIYLSTEMPTSDKPTLSLQGALGAFGFQRYQWKMGQARGNWTYFVNTSYNKTEGYRDWSAMENILLNGKLRYRLPKNGALTLLANVGNSPYARDPGGLTATQANEMPQQAGANNLLYETGESVDQYRVGLIYDQAVGQRQLFQVKIFRTARQLDNRLAIAANGYGELERQYQGAYLSYQWTGKRYRLKAGVDLDAQDDTRKRFAYQSSGLRFERGALALQQREQYQSRGVYVLQHWQPQARWLLMLGGRFDDLRLRTSDQFLSDGDQSGSRHFTRFNPTLGINFKLTENLGIYSNFATAFETPTLNELSNNPAGTGGFNPELQPQRASSFELGAKGFVPFMSGDHGLQLDVALFQVDSENDLAPYQLIAQPGKTFFRNVGRTRRRGVELGWGYAWHSNWQLWYTQTFSDFRFRSYQANNNDYTGNTLPGIPRFHQQMELRYTGRSGFFGSLTLRHVGKVMANDANTATAPAYALLHARLAHTLHWKGLKLEPFASIQNIANTRFMANVLLNAAGDRFFEPGAGRGWWAGLKIVI